jgi:ABC-2 type transport system ATP-binding protein
LQAFRAGDVRILGYDVLRHPTVVGRHLAFTPDTPALYDALTVVDFLRFIGGCYHLRGPALEERIDFWLQQLWLSEKRNSRVGTLSRGMRQRLAAVRSLLPDPHVLLMDEPAAGLDPAGRVQFRQLLASLRDQGKAIIVSSHILADLAEYCTHIAIMERGRMLSYGTVSDVAGAGARDICTYRVRLARAVDDLPARLAALNVENAGNVAHDSFSFDATNDPAVAARRLAELIAAGLPVAEFQRQRPDLEQAYLRHGIAQVD